MKGQNLRFRNYKFHLECGIYHHSRPALVVFTTHVRARRTRVDELRFYCHTSHALALPATRPLVVYVLRVAGGFEPSK